MDIKRHGLHGFNPCNPCLKYNQSLIFKIFAPKPSKSTCVHCSGALVKVSVLPVSKSFAL